MLSNKVSAVPERVICAPFALQLDPGILLDDNEDRGTLPSVQELSVDIVAERIFEEMSAAGTAHALPLNFRSVPNVRSGVTPPRSQDLDTGMPSVCITLGPLATRLASRPRDGS